MLAGGVDINAFPQQLISRVEVVTSGASAVYGSDAVSGVANFVLDKTYTGVKGEFSGGLTFYGDDLNSKFALAAGFDFGGGHGHAYPWWRRAVDAGCTVTMPFGSRAPWGDLYGRMPDPFGVPWAINEPAKAD